MAITNIIVDGIELAGSWGIGTLVGCTVNKIIPETLSTAEKVCTVVGAEMVTIATTRVVSREFRGQINELKETVQTIKAARTMKKLAKENTVEKVNEERKAKTVKRVKTTKQAEKA